MKDFDGKVAVITGTSNPKGIGRAIGKRLGALGSRLVLADKDFQGVQARAAEFKEAGLDAVAMEVDMGDRESVAQLATSINDEFGGVDILILNHVASSNGTDNSLLTPDPGPWELHAKVNLLGVVYGIKSFVPQMIASGNHCHVLATTSGAGTTGVMYGNGPYACTKSAITATMECLYGQLRDARADVVPGLIFPPLTDTFASPEAGQLVNATLRQFGATTVLSPPDEVADFTVDAIERDLFWAYPDLATDERLTGGRHAEAIAWENQIYQRRAAALIERSTPDSYLWGPPGI